MSPVRLTLFCVSIIWITVYSTTIPTIDLSESDEKCAKTLLNAATKYGFFYVINHGISYETTQQALEFSKQFFELNINTKMNVLSNTTHWGYIPYQDETTDATKQSVGDTKEGFYIHNNNNNKNTTIHPLYRENQWPSSTLLPNWRSVLEEYMNKLHSVSIKLTEIIALSLNLSANYFKSPGIRDNAMDLLYLLHYPPQKSDIENGIFGSGEHTDYDLFTILLTDNNAGLQILFQNNQWIDVEYKENSFIINIADTLQKWTNDLFKSSMHRVVINGENDRYSIPYFVASNYDLIIDCLPNTVIVNCNHSPFKAGEYLMLKLEETFTVYQEQSIHQDL